MWKQTACLYAILTLAAYGAIAQSSESVASRKVPSVPTNSASEPRSELIEGTVVGVEDGDTISVLTSDKISYRVRLQGIDAPEDRQPYFEKSRKHLSNLLLKEPVKALFHSKDPNGRLIATVYQNGRDVGLMQIEGGLAWHYKRFSFEQTAGVRKTYADAQAKAVSERKGLWDDKSPIPPWVFRGDSFAAPLTVPANVVDRLATPTGERKYFVGPRGGCYYLTDGGAKVYVKDKTLCGTTTPAEKP